MSTLGEELEGTLAELRESGLYKDEWEIETPQSAHVRVEGRGAAARPRVGELARAV